MREVKGADLCRLTPSGRRLISLINRLIGPYTSLVWMLRTIELRRARISWWSVGANIPFFSTKTNDKADAQGFNETFKRADNWGRY